MKGGIVVEDYKIVALYWKKDESAISETSHKYGAYCFAIADNILHNKEDSEECVNDTWLKAWNAMPPQRPAKLQMFLAKITRNLSFNRFNARSAEKRGGGEIVLVLDELAECIASETDVASEYEAKEIGQCIRRFVKALPERDGNIFVRRYFFTESTTQIAQKYSLTENNVMVILSRTRKKLKAHLVKEGFFSE
jgi:RNA polymerase sigma-70 factor (ECF subfamily)